MGRITASTQSTGGAAYPFSYTYWLNGALASVTYPSGRQMAYTLDTAGRVSSVTGTLSGTPTNYVSGVQYKPWNAIQQLSMQNGLTETWTYNARMQPFQATAAKSGSTLLTLNTWYCTGASPAQDCATNNGNIMQAWAGPSATPAYKQTFGYDSLNRLSSATEGAPWAQSYGYDIFGNRWATGTGPGIDSTTPSTSAWYDATTNHVVNALLPVAYDDAGAGNLKTLSGYLFSYDGENRMVRSTLNGIDTNYAYDGDGRRVQKTGSNSTTFVYDARGALAAEYSTQAPPVAGTEYVTVDHLGSTRLTTNANGNPIAYHDYVPFGAEIPAGVNGRSNLYGAADGMNKKFTGQYRDTETQSSAMTSGLDYFGARYFSAAQGRFTTPDWSEKPQPVPYAELSDPQSLNLYAYVRNNPLKNRDIDGHVCIFGFGNTCSTVSPPQPSKATTIGTDQLLQLSRQPRTLSPSGVAFVAKHEGYSSSVYNDQAGNPTVGYGHLIRKGEDFNKGVTKDQAEGLLHADAQSAEKSVNSNVKLWTSQNQFDALTSFTYNVGGGALAGSTLLRNVNGNSGVTEDNFTMFNKAGGQVSQGLTTRRKDEYALFEKQ